MTPREGSIVAERYRLVRKVGGGKMASVWQVFDEVSEELCALKLLAETMQGHPEALSRFSLEDRISREVKGPYFAERLGSGSFRSSRYIAWRWHEGESLRSLLERNSPLDAPSLHSMVSEVTKALAVVHGAGYVHGDIKPENIFFARAPGELTAQLKLFGFGVASRISQSKGRGAGRRRPGQVVGTPLYLSPARVKGHVACEPAADIWSLGVVVYESLTGRMPFLGSNEAEVYEAVLDRRAPLPSEVARVPSTVDLWWRQVLDEELGSVEDFILSLGRALAPALRTANTQRSPALKTVPNRQSLAKEPEPRPRAEASPRMQETTAPSAETTVSGAGPVVPRTSNAKTLQAGTRRLGSEPSAAKTIEAARPREESTRGTLAGTGDMVPPRTQTGARAHRPAATLPLPSTTGPVAQAAGATLSPPTHEPAPAAEPRADRAPRQFTPYPRQPTHLVLDGSRKTLVGLTPLLPAQPQAPSEAQRNEADRRQPNPIEGLPMRTIEGARQQEQTDAGFPARDLPEVRKPRYPTVPFPLAGFVAPAAKKEPSQPHSPAAQNRNDTQRENTQPARPSRGSGTLQIPIPTGAGGRQPQIVAGVVVCIALVLVLAVVSRGPGQPLGDFESATLSAQPQDSEAAPGSSAITEGDFAPARGSEPASPGLDQPADADSLIQPAAPAAGSGPAASSPVDSVPPPKDPASQSRGEDSRKPEPASTPRQSRKEFAPGLVVPEERGKVRASKKPAEAPRELVPRAPAAPSPPPQKARKPEPSNEEYDFGI